MAQSARAIVVMTIDFEHGDLCSYGLARTGGSSQKYVLVSVIESVEDLGLNGIEVLEVVQRFKLGVFQCRNWQWLEVQQSCVGWMALRKNQVLEGKSAVCLTSKPPERIMIFNGYASKNVFLFTYLSDMALT